MKKILVGALTCLFGFIAGYARQDPVLMRINGQDISRSEFESFYHRNKPSGVSGKEALKVCVDLFVDKKLKLHAAQRAGLDTLSAFRAEMDNYHRSLSKSYLTDSSAEEACARKLYDQMKSRSIAGEVRVMHIFRYLPQTALPHHLREAQALMDSLYNVLKTNPDTDFKTLVDQYSDDKAESWISWLQTPQEFEEVAFSLKDGEYSQPFFTPKGLHIVKVTGRRELPPFEQIRDRLIRKLSHRPGADKGTEILVNKLKESYRYTPDKAAMEELLFQGKTSRTLFTLDGKNFTGKDFERFAAAHPMGTKRQLDAFVVKSILDYENSHLEQKHPEFRRTLQEHRDHLLLAAITRRETHQVSLADSVALKNFFKEHRTDYNWDSPRYRGAVLHGTHKKTLKSARKFLKKLPEEEWKDAIRLTFNTSASPAVIRIEQGTFAEGDNVFVDKLVFKKGDFEPLKSYPFTVVLGEKKKGPESYKEIVSRLIEDYQNHLDALWAERLRASAKVEINQEVLKTVNNH